MLMNILIATVFPLPGGGIWSFVSNLSAYLVGQGHNVDILCTRDNNSKVVMLGTETVFDLSQYRSYVEKKLMRSVPHLARNPWVYHAELNRYIFEQGVTNLDMTKYDIIHAQDVISAVALSRVKPTGVPLITSGHGFLTGAIFHQYKSLNTSTMDQAIWNSFIIQYYARLEQVGYESSDFIHTSSQWMRGIIEKEFKIDTFKIHTYKYGVELSHFKIDTPIQRQPAKKIILVNSRLVYLKGLHNLIEALSFLRYRDKWECWILGEGELEKSLKESCRKLGIEKNVLFWGNTSKVKEILYQSDMLVLPSLQENQPFAVIEAQLLGVPTIVSNAGGLPEMVENNKNGFIIEKGNNRQLSEKIEYLLNNPAIRDQMSKYASQKGRELWDVNILGRNIVQLYSKAIQKKKRLW
jgi:glycosyltransferase involved in cell wall biosynthesis